MSAGIGDGERDALALIAAGLAGDELSTGVVFESADLMALVAAFIALVGELLRDAGEDPAEWVARRQQRLREDLARDGL